jgi:hypothetical protein
LRPLRWDLLTGVFRAAATDCRTHGVPIVLALIPRVGKPVDLGERHRLLNMARDVGFTTVIDACDVYEGADPRDLAIGPNDFHPNALGHARIARALETALAAQPELVQLRKAPQRDTAVLQARGNGPDAEEEANP